MGNDGFIWDYILYRLPKIKEMKDTSTTKIWMTQEDADIVQQIFERTDEPFFSIIARANCGADLCQLEIAFQSSMSLWHLAKQVQMEQDHTRRMKELIDNSITKMIETIKPK